MLNMSICDFFFPCTIFHTFTCAFLHWNTYTETDTHTWLKKNNNVFDLYTFLPVWSKSTELRCLKSTAPGPCWIHLSSWIAHTCANTHIQAQHEESKITWTHSQNAYSRHISDQEKLHSLNEMSWVLVKSAEDISILFHLWQGRKTWTSAHT